MRVLFTVWPYSGHLNPCLAVALALRERGHEVAFYTGEAASDPVTGEGFRRYPFRAVARRAAALVSSPDSSDRPELYRRLTERYSNIAAGPLDRLRHIQTFYLENVVGSVPEQVEDLRPLLASFDPDVVVTDAFLWAPVLILSETQPAPVAILSFFGGCLVPGADAPPPGLGLPRPCDWRSRAVSRFASLIAHWVTAGVRSATDQVRHRHGLPALGRPFFENAAGVPLHMVTCSPEYDYERKDLPPTVHYVGPCIYDPPMQPQGWKQRLVPGRPVIYVSEGTCQVREPKVLKAAVDGLGGTSLQVVMSTGTHRQLSLSDLASRADNVTIEPWVSHAELFPLASAVVTNGGSGTVRAALQTGLPLVVIPMEWDQLENAQRVAGSGAGIRLSLKNCDGPRLREAVERVLGDPSFGRNARRLAASFTRYGNGRKAAELIEGLSLAGPPPHKAAAGARHEQHQS
jgi:UDP:flavonoid glycosyltransferase YjiC (YdhE family)